MESFRSEIKWLSNHIKIAAGVSEDQATEMVNDSVMRIVDKAPRSPIVISVPKLPPPADRRTSRSPTVFSAPKLPPAPDMVANQRTRARKEWNVYLHIKIYPRLVCSIFFCSPKISNQQLSSLFAVLYYTSKSPCGDLFVDKDGREHIRHTALCEARAVFKG